MNARFNRDFGRRGVSSRIESSGAAKAATAGIETQCLRHNADMLGLNGWLFSGTSLFLNLSLNAFEDFLEKRRAENCPHSVIFDRAKSMLTLVRSP